MHVSTIVYMSALIKWIRVSDYSNHQNKIFSSEHTLCNSKGAAKECRQRCRTLFLCLVFTSQHRFTIDTACYRMVSLIIKLKTELQNKDEFCQTQHSTERVRANLPSPFAHLHPAGALLGDSELQFASPPALESTHRLALLLWQARTSSCFPPPLRGHLPVHLIDEESRSAGRSDPTLPASPAPALGSRSHRSSSSPALRQP
jgi:hypothetical protein